MANRKGQEQGNRSPRQFRTGIDIPYFKGLNRDYDAGAISDTELQDAINIRLIGGRIDCRGGQEKLNETPLEGCVWSIDDLPLPVVGIYLTPFTHVQQPLDRYNTDFSPDYATIFQNEDLTIADPIIAHSQFMDVSLPRQVIFVWRGKLLVHNSQQISEVVLPKNNADGEVSLRPLVDLGAQQIASFAEVPEAGESILYIGSLTSNEVYRYDGTWLSTDGAIGFNSMRQIVGRFHDRLYICGQQFLLVRNPGAPLVNGLPAPGTYAQITMPGTVTTFQPSRIVEWQDQMFIVGKDLAIAPAPGTPGPGCILMYDGSTLTLVRQPTNTDNAPFTPAIGVSDGIVWNNKFWYLWKDTDNVTLVGNYDGSTWNDKVANLGAAENTSDCGDFVLANGLLYLTTTRGQATPGPGLDNSQVFLSSGDGVTWTLVKNITALDSDYQTTLGPPNLVVFQ